MSNTDHLLLKWGTLKGYQISKTNERATAILNDLEGRGRSFSVMTQHDSPEEKQLLLDLIDAHDGEIWNDWDGEQYTKEQAKDYVRNYGKRS